MDAKRTEPPKLILIDNEFMIPIDQPMEIRGDGMYISIADPECTATTADIESHSLKTVIVDVDQNNIIDSPETHVLELFQFFIECMIKDENLLYHTKGPFTLTKIINRDIKRKKSSSDLVFEENQLLFHPCTDIETTDIDSLMLPPSKLEVWKSELDPGLHEGILSKTLPMSENKWEITFEYDHSYEYFNDSSSDGQPGEWIKPFTPQDWELTYEYPYGYSQNYSHEPGTSYLYGITSGLEGCMFFYHNGKCQFDEKKPEKCSVIRGHCYKKSLWDLFYFQGDLSGFNLGYQAAMQQAKLLYSQPPLTEFSPEIVKIISEYSLGDDDSNYQTIFDLFKTLFYC